MLYDEDHGHPFRISREHRILDFKIISKMSSYGLYQCSFLVKYDEFNKVRWVNQEFHLEYLHKSSTIRFIKKHYIDKDAMECWAY